MAINIIAQIDETITLFLRFYKQNSGTSRRDKLRNKLTQLFTEGTHTATEHFRIDY